MVKLYCKAQMEETTLYNSASECVDIPVLENTLPNHLTSGRQNILFDSLKVMPLSAALASILSKFLLYSSTVDPWTNTFVVDGDTARNPCKLLADGVVEYSCRTHGPKI